MCNNFSPFLIFIAAITSLIAFFQWITARQKIVLDLFDKRLEVFNQVNEAVTDFLSGTGDLALVKTNRELRSAESKSTFLFGPEASDYIKTLIQQVSGICVLRSSLKAISSPSEEHTKTGDKIASMEETLGTWRERWTAICSDYLRMDQKMYPNLILRSFALLTKTRIE